MATLRELIASREKLRNNVPNCKPCQIRKYIPDPVHNAIAISAKFDSMKGGGHYAVLMVFKELDIERERDELHPIGIEILPGQWGFFERPSASGTRVGVVCTCPDYYFTWWKWNKNNGAFASVNMPAYQRTTPKPPVGRPYKNPNQEMGVCKHIIAMGDKLLEGNWLGS